MLDPRVRGYRSRARVATHSRRPLAEGEFDKKDEKT